MRLVTIDLDSDPGGWVRDLGNDEMSLDGIFKVVSSDAKADETPGQGSGNPGVRTDGPDDVLSVGNGPSRRRFDYIGLEAELIRFARAHANLEKFAFDHKAMGAHIQTWVDQVIARIRNDRPRGRHEELG